ncbi:MAG: hypothetical protein WD534_03245 [Phycisphaeraceae bacterium]
MATLQARSPHCFSSTYVLHLDGRPHGEFVGRMFGEGFNASMAGRQRLAFHRSNWIGSHMTLTDEASGQVLGTADRAGFFTSAWDLSLTSGPAQLVSAGIFHTGYEITNSSGRIGTVTQIGMFEGGWTVTDHSGTLRDTDLLVVGLTYQTIVNRRRRQSSSHAGAGAAT